jgi:hypothetical protein
MKSFLNKRYIIRLHFKSLILKLLIDLGFILLQYIRSTRKFFNKIYIYRSKIILKIIIKIHSKVFWIDFVMSFQKNIILTTFHGYLVVLVVLECIKSEKIEILKKWKNFESIFLNEEDMLEENFVHMKLSIFNELFKSEVSFEFYADLREQWGVLRSSMDLGHLKLKKPQNPQNYFKII